MLAKVERRPKGPPLHFCSTMQFFENNYLFKRCPFQFLRSVQLGRSVLLLEGSPCGFFGTETFFRMKQFMEKSNFMVVTSDIFWY